MPLYFILHIGVIQNSNMFLNSKFGLLYINTSEK
jgi:hypothetical protein